MLLSTVPPKMYIASEITAAAWKSLPLGNWGKKIGNKQREKDKEGKVINKSLFFCQEKGSAINRSTVKREKSQNICGYIYVEGTHRDC